MTQPRYKQLIKSSLEQLPILPCMPQQIYHWVACVTNAYHLHNKEGAIQTLRSRLPTRCPASHPLLWKISVLIQMMVSNARLVHTTTLIASLSSLVKPEMTVVELYCP